MNKDNNKIKITNIPKLVKIITQSFDKYIDNVYIKYTEKQYIQAFGMIFLIYIPGFILLATKIICASFASQSLANDIKNIEINNDKNSIIAAISRDYHGSFDSEIKAGQIALNHGQNNIEILEKSLTHFTRAFYNSNNIEEKIISSILYQSAFVNIYSMYSRDLGEIGIQSVQSKIRFNDLIFNCISSPYTYTKILDSEMSNENKLRISSYLLESSIFISRFKTLPVFNVLETTQSILNSMRGFVYQLDIINKCTQSIYSAYSDQF